MRGLSSRSPPRAVALPAGGQREVSIIASALRMAAKNTDAVIEKIFRDHAEAITAFEHDAHAACWEVD